MLSTSNLLFPSSALNTAPLLNHFSGPDVSARREDPVPTVPSSNVPPAKVGSHSPPPTMLHTPMSNAVIWAYAIAIPDSANALPASRERRVNTSHVNRIVSAMVNVCRWRHSPKIAM